MPKACKITCTSSRGGRPLTVRDRIELPLMMLDAIAAVSGISYSIRTDGLMGEERELLAELMREKGSKT